MSHHTPTCPTCGSSNVTQTADHSANGYECNDCNTTFGN